MYEYSIHVRNLISIEFKEFNRLLFKQKNIFWFYVFMTLTDVVLNIKYFLFAFMKIFVISIVRIKTCMYASIKQFFCPKDDYIWKISNIKYNVFEKLEIYSNKLFINKLIIILYSYLNINSHFQKTFYNTRKINTDKYFSNNITKLIHFLWVDWNLRGCTVHFS